MWMRGGGGITLVRKFPNNTGKFGIQRRKNYKEISLNNNVIFTPLVNIWKMALVLGQCSPTL
jgi:hypothetical protein